MTHNTAGTGLSRTPEKLIHVAKWAARGMHAGQVVTLRVAPGDHRWRVVVKLKRPSSIAGKTEVDQMVFDADKPCPIRAMHEIVLREIATELPDGALVNDESLDFYIPSKR